MFQSTGSRGARPWPEQPGPVSKSFQSTGSRGARRGNSVASAAAFFVSIHGLAWSPTQPFQTAGTIRRFQSTGSRGARQRLLPRAGSIPGFNPRARVEPDPEGKTICNFYRKVSIHGLAWSPTHSALPPFRGGGVSIHGLAWSPTLALAETAASRRGFNPRARVEPDPKSALSAAPYRSFNPRARVEPDFGIIWILRQNDVSIHGLAWSPTSTPWVPCPARSVSIHGLAWSPTSKRLVFIPAILFQSTGSRGARQRENFSDRGKTRFQSTGSRGARHSPARNFCAVISFNPRARVEPDGRARPSATRRTCGFNPRARVEPDMARANWLKVWVAMFQSTGSRGARPRTGRLRGLARRVSIHGLAWSPTSADGQTIAVYVRFQSTGSRGARPIGKTRKIPIFLFQSTGSRGARLE